MTHGNVFTNSFLISTTWIVNLSGIIQYPYKGVITRPLGFRMRSFIKMKEHRCTFRFYAELNDFLPPSLRQKPFEYSFDGKPSVKDAIEANGVPHTEVELILINGESKDFTCHLTGNERISVYPVFESVDIRPVLKVRLRPLRDPRFVLDVHLGTLARRLRLLGFDALYENDYHDQQIIRIAESDKRIILTRDKGILKNRRVSHGYYIRATHPDDQIREVVERLDLKTEIRPFTRCIHCNGLLHSVEKNRIVDELEPLTQKYYHDFLQCERCGKIYWEGTHVEKMKAWLMSFISGKY